ncbi:hypothetical protein SSPO_026170 [Streptomyces antimycoticus]|uniref:Uncharacterized protein n=1 Tax=Streptomyces antimycoticus TaxID=68175 RepID=A0A499USK4_9ACTN|nr:hypothetical protein SSPO_026170 [Streptomyces antimycoticus]
MDPGGTTTGAHGAAAAIGMFFWTAPHIDAVRRLQAVLLGPARAASEQCLPVRGSPDTPADTPADTPEPRRPKLRVDTGEPRLVEVGEQDGPHSAERPTIMSGTAVPSPPDPPRRTAAAQLRPLLARPVDTVHKRRHPSSARRAV